MYVSTYATIPQRKPASTSLTTAKVIELVRQTRNNMVRHYQDNCIIAVHFRDYYQVNEISDLKVKFLKRDLEELYNSPLDLVHYASVIKEIKDSNDTERINKHEYCQLFKNQINAIYKKYIF